MIQVGLLLPLETLSLPSSPGDVLFVLAEPSREQGRGGELSHKHHFGTISSGGSINININNNNTARLTND